MKVGAVCGNVLYSTVFGVVFLTLRSFTGEYRYRFISKVIYGKLKKYDMSNFSYELEDVEEYYYRQAGSTPMP